MQYQLRHKVGFDVFLFRGGAQTLRPTPFHRGREGGGLNKLLRFAIIAFSKVNNNLNPKPYKS